MTRLKDIAVSSGGEDGAAKPRDRGIVQRAMRFLPGHALAVAGAVALALALVACDDSAAGDAGSPTGGTGGGVAEGGGGSGGEVSTGGAPLVAPLYLAVLAESGPGNEPGLVRFFNDTAGDLISLAIGDGQFYAWLEVPAASTTDYLPKALGDLATTVEVGVHTNDACVNFPLSELVGPSAITPGLAYTLRVEDLAPETFRLEVIEEAAPDPFVGARVLVTSPGSGPPDKAVQLTLSLDGAAPLVFDDAYDSSVPSQYVLVPTGGLAIGGVEFRDRSGQLFASDEAEVVEGAFGYTLVVSADPVAEAVFTATLEPQPPE